MQGIDKETEYIGRINNSTGCENQRSSPVFPVRVTASSELIIIQLIVQNSIISVMSPWLAPRYTFCHIFNLNTKKLFTFSSSPSEVRLREFFFSGVMLRTVYRVASYKRTCGE